MRKPTPKKNVKNAIRLACVKCDREDYDGIDAIPEDWDEVGPIVYETQDPHCWWTHLGWCPDCRIS